MRTERELRSILSEYAKAPSRFDFGAFVLLDYPDMIVTLLRSTEAKPPFIGISTGAVSSENAVMLPGARAKIDFV